MKFEKVTPGRLVVQASRLVELVEGFEVLVRAAANASNPEILGICASCHRTVAAYGAACAQALQAYESVLRLSGDKHPREMLVARSELSHALDSFLVSTRTFRELERGYRTSLN